jgi:hypothetical protein
MTKINYNKGITTLEAVIFGLIILIIIIIGLGSGYRNFGNSSYYQTRGATYGYQAPSSSTSYSYQPGSTSTTTSSWSTGGTTGGASWWGSTGTVTPGTTYAPASTCLPAGIKMTDVVSATTTGYANGQPIGLVRITVQQKLNELGAGCSNGKLISATTGKEITFYNLKGCWGAYPPDGELILQQQENELASLRTKYTVIEMTCNPGGIPLR